MKTISSDYVKEVKDEMKKINSALKCILEAEAREEQSTNSRDYLRAYNDRQNANIELMQSLEEIVRLASSMSSISGLTNILTAHKIVEYRL